jgi:phospholipase D-like protein/putative oligomerization/nucleic acid binding protein
MDSISTDFWDVLLWSFWIFIWFSALMVWFRCLFDMFGDSTLSGWAKAGWALVLVFLPWIGALIYLIARGRSMQERQMAAVSQARAAQEDYIQQVAGKAATPTEQIADARALLDSGAIDQSEFDTLKAKALA